MFVDKPFQMFWSAVTRLSRYKDIMYVFIQTNVVFYSLVRKSLCDSNRSKSQTSVPFWRLQCMHWAKSQSQSSIVVLKSIKLNDNGHRSLGLYSLFSTMIFALQIHSLLHSPPTEYPSDTPGSYTDISWTLLLL